MLLVDSWYDNFKGVVLLVRVFDGTISAGDQIYSFATKNKYTVGEVGIQYPDSVAQSRLRAGQVGYLFFNPGMKRIQDAKIGDTFTKLGKQKEVVPFPGFRGSETHGFRLCISHRPSRLSKNIGEYITTGSQRQIHHADKGQLGGTWSRLASGFPWVASTAASSRTGCDRSTRATSSSRSPACRPRFLPGKGW